MSFRCLNEIVIVPKFRNVYYDMNSIYYAGNYSILTQTKKTKLFNSFLFCWRELSYPLLLAFFGAVLTCMTSLCT
jgi:hypothetical protein